MPRTSTGLTAGTSDQSTSAGAAGGRYSSPSSSAAACSSRCSGLSRDSRWPRASTTESTVRTAPPASPTSNRHGRRPRPGRGSVADGGRRRVVELHRGAGGEAGQQLLQGGAQVAAVQGPAGEVRRRPARTSSARSSAVREGWGCCCCSSRQRSKVWPASGRARSGSSGMTRGIERLGVHQVQPGLAGLPDVPRARGIGVDDVNVQGGVRPGGHPVGQQPLQHARAPGAGANHCRPDALRYAHGIQRIRYRHAALTCRTPPGRRSAGRRLDLLLARRCCLDGKMTTTEAAPPPASDRPAGAATEGTAPEPVDENIWLEEIYGEEQLAWVREQNARTEELLEDAEYAALEGSILEVLDSTDRIAMVGKHGDWYYNFWKDRAQPQGPVAPDQLGQLPRRVSGVGCPAGRGRAGRGGRRGVGLPRRQLPAPGRGRTAPAGAAGALPRRRRREPLPRVRRRVPQLRGPGRRRLRPADGEGQRLLARRRHPAGRLHRRGTARAPRPPTPGPASSCAAADPWPRRSGCSKSPRTT